MRKLADKMNNRPVLSEVEWIKRPNFNQRLLTNDYSLTTNNMQNKPNLKPTASPPTTPNASRATNNKQSTMNYEQ
jgi:hypothetical protein